MTESEPAALPLGYAPGCLVWLDWLRSSVVMVANYCQQVIAQRLMPDSLVIRPQPGHFVQEDAPDLVAGVVCSEKWSRAKSKKFQGCYPADSHGIFLSRSSPKRAA